MKTLKTAFPWLLLGLVACAGTIKVWSSNSVITAADLNANFNHIHSLMVGGHGARLVDADVSPTAAIAVTKIAGFTAPKAYASMSATCDTTVTAICTGIESSHVSSIFTDSTAGVLSVTLDYTPTNSNFGVITTGTLAGYCYPVTLATSAPHILFTCRNTAGVAINSPRLQFAVYDQ